jgi:hypothetical protein
MCVGYGEKTTLCSARREMLDYSRSGSALARRTARRLEEDHRLGRQLHSRQRGLTRLDKRFGEARAGEQVKT